VTKTCSQCGAVLPSSVLACQFCDSSFSVGPSIWDDSATSSSSKTIAARPRPGASASQRPPQSAVVSDKESQEVAWRGELSQRLEAYRTRRRKVAPNVAQSQFSFDNNSSGRLVQTAVEVAETPATVEDDFSFTLAIGRPSKKLASEESRVTIDVSQPPDSESILRSPTVENESISSPGLHPVASIDDRRLAAVIDLCCLFFAYGGFLMLFGSLGGQFTLSKLTAAIYVAAFAIVYLQYFALFTIFGGTTPGMMMRGLQVVSFSGEPPTPRQMLLRTTGYLLSAGTFFMGFLWAIWDEDELTWHDRISGTHLSVAQTYTDLENSGIAHSR
jgi:uncharacterized RDD family membrane protein YckC